jgi:hypothetical protein
MRLSRMSQFPDLCDVAAYQGTLCSKFAAPRQHERFLAKSNIWQENWFPIRNSNFMQIPQIGAHGLKNEPWQGYWA